MKTGYLLIASAEDREALERNVELQREAGVAAEVIAPEDVPAGFRVADDEACAYEPESGYADPHSVTQGYATAARGLGAQVRVQEPVHGITVSGGRVTGVTTSRGEISTPVAVVAAGPWSAPLLREVGVEAPLETVRHQVITLRRPETEPEHAIVGDIPNSLSARPDIGRLTLVGVGEEERVGPDELNHGVDQTMVEGGRGEADRPHAGHGARGVPGRLVGAFHDHAGLAPDNGASPRNRWPVLRRRLQRTRIQAGADGRGRHGRAGDPGHGHHRRHLDARPRTLRRGQADDVPLRNERTGLAS